MHEHGVEDSFFGGPLLLQSCTQQSAVNTFASGLIVHNKKVCIVTVPFPAQLRSTQDSVPSNTCSLVPSTNSSYLCAMHPLLTHLTPQPCACIEFNLVLALALVPALIQEILYPRRSPQS